MFSVHEKTEELTGINFWVSTKPAAPQFICDPTPEKHWTLALSLNVWFLVYHIISSAEYKERPTELQQAIIKKLNNNDQSPSSLTCHGQDSLS